MNMSSFEIFTAIVMVVVAITLFFAIRQYMAAQSERRMVDMMEEVGLDPTIPTRTGPHSVMREIRRRCRHCTSEDVCERWLAGEIGGDNDFCPNRAVFESMKKTIAAPG